MDSMRAALLRQAFAMEADRVAHMEALIEHCGEHLGMGVVVLFHLMGGIDFYASPNVPAGSYVVLPAGN